VYWFTSTKHKKFQRDIAGIAAINNAREILLIKDKLNRWKLPSGGIEKREGSLEAAKREFLEETGYKIYEILGLLSITEFTKHTEDFYSFIYTGKVNTRLNRIKEQ